MLEVQLAEATAAFDGADGTRRWIVERGTGYPAGNNGSNGSNDMGDHSPFTSHFSLAQQ